MNAEQKASAIATLSAELEAAKTSNTDERLVVRLEEALAKVEALEVTEESPASEE